MYLNTSVVWVRQTTENQSTNGTSHNVTSGDDGCDTWDSSQHALYQLANFCFVVAFLAPNTLNFHSLILRSLLCVGSFCLVLWSGIISCYPDILGWCIANFFINLCFLVLAIYKNFPVRFDPKLEQLFIKTFSPMKMSRTQFKELTRTGQVRQLPGGTVYAAEGSTTAGEKLSMLLSGRLQVSCDECFLHYIEPDQFVDSPEYDARLMSRRGRDCFQVTIRTVGSCDMLTWSSQDLQQYLDTDNLTSILLHHLVGKDITSKLYQIQELLLSQPQRRVSLPVAAKPATRPRTRIQQSLPDHFAAADVMCPAIGRDLTKRPSFCEMRRTSLVPNLSCENSPHRYAEHPRRNSCMDQRRRNSSLQLPSETAL